jgi:hypothetical protein
LSILNFILTWSFFWSSSLSPSFKSDLKGIEICFYSLNNIIGVFHWTHYFSGFSKHHYSNLPRPSLCPRPPDPIPQEILLETNFRGTIIVINVPPRKRIKRTYFCAFDKWNKHIQRKITASLDILITDVRYSSNCWSILFLCFFFLDHFFHNFESVIKAATVHQVLTHNGQDILHLKCKSSSSSCIWFDITLTFHWDEIIIWKNRLVIFTFRSFFRNFKSSI